MTLFENTCCNPIPLPDYPRGACTYGDKPTQTGFLQNPPMDFRETADPSVLYCGGKWYLYPSCGMAWMSEDFRTWTHHRIEPYGIGYAPTAVEHRGRFLLTACHAPVFAADHPLGPFKELGKLRKPDGAFVEPFADPMLFADAAPEPWTTVFESDPSQDMPIDYRTFATRRATRIRLEILGTPPGIRPGLVDFSVFGIGLAE
jgi:hypothetical protein